MRFNKLHPPSPETQEKMQHLSLLHLFRPHEESVPDPPYERLKASLRPFLPPASLDIVSGYLACRSVILKIVKHRNSKSGDFRPARKGRKACITINSTLNPYAFLITLVHELAHFEVFQRFMRPQPHGSHWKSDYHRLMAPLLFPDIFPERLLSALKKHMENPRATTAADPVLNRAIREFDPVPEGILLADLPLNACFSIHNRRTFQKKEKLRQRCRCICLQTGKAYLVHGSLYVKVLTLP